MKRSFCLFLLFYCVFIPFYAIEVFEIPAASVEAIALRNAEALWGSVSQDTAIPMYDLQDNLVAWQFNFSIQKQFPKRDELLARIVSEGENFYDAKWNHEEFAHIICGARTDKAPIIAYGRGLSEHYHNYYRMKEQASINLSADYMIVKEIFLSMGWHWYVVSSKDQIYYIKASPPYVFCDREEFLARNTNSHYPIKLEDYSDSWQEYTGGQILSRNYIYVENSQVIPFISYSYGCTPTSGAMLNEYYKNNSPNVEGHFTKLVNNYFRRWDSISSAMRFHVSDAHRDIAEEMSTDTDIWGMTLPWNVAAGMGYYYISRGHAYWGNVYSWYYNYAFSSSAMFNDLKYEINQNTPALMNTWNHTICAIGYENSSRMIALHDPNANYVRFWNVSDFWYLMKIHPRPKAEGEYVNLLSPDGGQGWSGNGSGEVLRQNSVYEIRWEGDLSASSLVDIYYCTHPDFPLINREVIALNQPNTGYYPWLVPSYLVSESVRIQILVKNAQSEYLGYDCSWGQFSVTSGGSVSVISEGSVNTVNSSPMYCRINTPNSVPAWGVIGIRKNTAAASQIDIWDQNFSTKKISSSQDDKLNWVVFDKNHAPDTQLGIRVAVQAQDYGYAVQFEGGDHHLATGTNNIVWNTGEIVRVYDVQLQTGINTFSLNHTSGFGNMGIALYGSQGSWYLPKDSYLGYSDDNPGFGRESFSVWIPQTDVYGLVIWSHTASAYGNMTLNIGSSGMWTGAVSSAWNLGANWASGNVPSLGDDVFIPGVVGNKPYLDDGIVAICRDLIIANGAWITLANANLQVTGSAKIYGEFKTLGASQISFWQSVIWYDGSQLSDLGISEFQALRDWTVQPNASVLMNNSSLRFAGTENSVMHILGTQNMFSGLTIQKGSSASVSINAEAAIKVKTLSVLTPVSFLGESILELSVALNSNGGISFQSGTLKLTGTGMKTINCLVTDQFYDIEVNGAVLVNNNLRAIGSIRLISGNLYLGNYTLSVGRSLTTQGGQLMTSDYLVKFTGAATSQCNLGSIKNLELAKHTNGEVLIPTGASLSCDSYYWTSGAIRVQGGASFTVNDLANVCIKGRYYLEGGTIELHQDSSQGVDLDADLFIYSGTFNVYGGYNFPSEWAYTRTITVHMEGGVLDFKDRGIKLASGGYYLNAVISGGTIRTSGDFVVERFGFNPGGGTIELYGSGTSYARIANPSTAYNLSIQKSGRAGETISDDMPNTLQSSQNPGSENDLRTNQVIFNGASTINNNLVVNSGTLRVSNSILTINNDLIIHGACNLSAANERINVNGSILWQSASIGTISNGVISVAKDWISHAQSLVNVLSPALIQVIGNTNSIIQLNRPGDAYLGNIVINKTSASCTITPSSANQQIFLGLLAVNEGSTFYPGNGIYQISQYFRIEPSASVFLNSATINTPDYKQFGALNMVSGIIRVNGFFSQYPGSNSQVSGGSILVETPYNGSYYSFEGTMTMSDGLIHILHNGMNVGSSMFTMTGGKIKLGFHFIATQPNSFLGSGGIVEFAGAGLTHINMGSGNYFPKLVINQQSGQIVRLNTDITVKKSCEIWRGNLELQNYKLSIDENLVIDDIGYLFANQPNAQIWLKGSWTNEGNTQNFDEGTSLVVMTPNAFSHIRSSETFYNLKIGQTSGSGSVNFLAGITVNISNNLELERYGLWLDDGCTLNVYGNVSVSGGANFVVQGDDSDIAFANINGDLTLNNSRFTIIRGQVNHLGHLVTNPGSTVKAVLANYTNSAEGVWQLLNCQWDISWDSIIEFSNKGIQLVSGCDVSLDTNSTFKTGKDFYATSEGVTSRLAGVVEFIGTTQAGITLGADNKLSVVEIRKNGTSVVLQSNVVFLGNLEIHSGTFNSNGYTIEIMGAWINNAGPQGYVCGTSEVIFKYNRTNLWQTIIGSQTFYNVTINHISNSTHLEDFSSYTITILNNLVIVRGNVELRYLNVKNITIPVSSYLKTWILGLSGNVLDYNPVISDVYGQRSGLIVSSALNLLGDTDQYLNIAAPGFGVNSILLNKSGGAFKPGKPIAVNNLTVENGTWSYQTPGLSHTVYWNLEIGANGSWADNTGTLIFAGANTDSNVKIYGTASFNNILINKGDSARIVSLSHTDWNTGSTADFIIQRGIFRITARNFQTGGNITVMDGAKLSLVNNASVTMLTSTILNVQSGGALETHGSETQKALFTNLNGMNEFYIQSGATVSASNTIFEKVGYNGVYVMNGAYVDPLHSFTNCEFRYGFMFGTLLTINNNQHLTIENPVFISGAAPWGSTYNVSKNENWGSLTINGESGAFSGYLYEWDPFTRINWSTDIPQFWANASQISFGEVAWGSTAFQYLDVFNIGSAPLSGVIIIPDGFTAVPYGRIDTQSGSREMLSISKSETDSASNRDSMMDFQIYPGGGMTYKVSFVPNFPGEYNANMTFYHNAPDAMYNVALSGFARGAKIVTNPDTLRFELLPGMSGSQILGIANAGNDSLGYYAMISYSRNRDLNTIVQDGFEGTFPPMGWMEQVLSGSNVDWSSSNLTVHPYGQPPHGGNRLAYFNSYTCYSGASARLISPQISLMSSHPTELSFWMYHENGYSGSNDRIQVQVSTDWFTWSNLGEPVVRPSVQVGWAEHVFDLSAYNGSNIYIGLLGISAYGNDIHIDDFHVYSIMPPTGWVSLNGNSNVMGTVFPGDDPANVNVQVNAEMLPIGTHQATIYIYSNDYVDWYKRVPLELTIGTPGIEISEPYLAWGMTQVGFTDLQYVSIHNPGTISLHATASTTEAFGIVDPSNLRRLSGQQSEYNFVSKAHSGRRSNIELQDPQRDVLELSIPAGESYGFYIAFTPTAAQGYSGNLIISSDALPEAGIALYGNGVDYPVISTESIESVTNQSAIVNAIVHNDGGMMLLERGVCFNTSGSPVYTDAKVVSEGNTGEFSCLLNTLNHSTQFFVRAYAKNSIGISYGEELSFTTFTPGVSINTTNLSDFGLVPINTSSQEGSFSISGEHLLMSIWIAVDENSGFAMSLNSNRDEREYVSALELVPSNGLLPETTVYVIFCPADTGYVQTSINGQSAGLGAAISIGLSGTGVSLPTVANGVVFDIGQTSATGSGLVMDNALAPIIAMGICWGSNPEPEITDNAVIMDYEQGWFYCQMQDLQPGTHYYYRAFATNIAGTSYSYGESFYTTQMPYLALDDRAFGQFGNVPIGTITEPDTLYVSGIGLGASITVSVPEGFEISTSLEPLGRNYASIITLYPTTGVLAETPLFIRFSPVSGGSYSDYLLASGTGVSPLEFMLIGTGITLAEISTKPVNNLTYHSADTGGIIISSGWNPSSARGVCWSTEPDPTLADNYTMDYQEPEFISHLTDLQSNTTYYVRAYVTNDIGTSYGEVISFTTTVMALSAPQNVRLSLQQSRMLLQWNAVENAVSYHIYRSTDPALEDWGLPIDVTDTTTWIDADITNRYFYKVVASTEQVFR